MVSPFSCISSLSWLPLEEPRSTRSTRKGRTRKPCLWRFRLFEYFESFVVTLGRTTKYTKYTKGKNKEAVSLTVSAFRVFCIICGYTWKNQEIQEIKERE